MKSSVIYARYDSITPRGGWVESGWSPETEVASEWQSSSSSSSCLGRCLKTEMLLVPRPSRWAILNYTLHTHVEVLPCTERENERRCLESKGADGWEQWTGECAIASVHPGCVSLRFYVPSHIIEFYFYWTGNWIRNDVDGLRDSFRISPDSMPGHRWLCAFLCVLTLRHKLRDAPGANGTLDVWAHLVLRKFTQNVIRGVCVIFIICT